MFYAKKSLGQNFLINAGILEKIVATAELNSGDTVLEIGPGTGNLTKLLCEKASRIIAIEKDHRLIENLKIKFPTVEIVEGDVLKLDIRKLFESCKLKVENCDYKVIGNIPYYITANLLRIIFEKWPKPKLIVLTVQKEVAQRIVAKPPDMNPVKGKMSHGTSAGHAHQAGRTSNGMNLLALSVQFYAEPKIIGYVSRGSFRPMPKVDSAIIKLVPHNTQHATEETEMFFRLVKAGFSGKRKQLANNLGKGLGLSKAKIVGIIKELGLDEKIRAENLSLDKWIELSHLL